MGNHKSKCLNIICGVPQGSLLGPTVDFNTNNIWEVFDIGKLVFFCAWHNFLCLGEDWQQLLFKDKSKVQKTELFQGKQMNVKPDENKFYTIQNCQIKQSYGEMHSKELPKKHLWEQIIIMLIPWSYQSFRQCN